MQHLNSKDNKVTMTPVASKVRAYQPTNGSHELPAGFESAVLQFDADSAALAFDVLGHGGQYGIVGRYKYVVTRRHVELLDEAKIPYEVRSAG